ncbi:hypothetical protein V6N11_055042 [Hibiscus sabdariffa]|uniref:Uncharacterized protein n=1 Tax=Hibiscus sabdariffa TaxID=183260 RepID=A0ABR2P3X4_9ROSI
MELPMHSAYPAPARVSFENSFAASEGPSHIVSEQSEFVFSHPSYTQNDAAANGLGGETNVNGDNVLLSTSRSDEDVNVNTEDIAMSHTAVDATYEIAQPAVIPTENIEPRLSDDDELPTEESCEVPSSVGQEMQEGEQQSDQVDCDEQSNLQALRESVVETDTLLEETEWRAVVVEEYNALINNET